MSEKNDYICEIRCKKCGKLLMKADKKVKGIEIKCPRCGYVNKY